MNSRTLILVGAGGLLVCSSSAARVPQAQPAPPVVFAIVRALDDAASRRLWPGFDTSSLPIALFDGEHTILLRHPSPPPEFSPMPDRPGAFVAPGRHPAVVSNSTRDIAGVRTATVIATPAQSVESTALAVIEEVFHVFWLARHTAFRPDEMARYAYPISNVENLRGLLAEDEALARALTAADDDEAARWSAAALTIRRERVPALAEDVRSFETSLEMMEGTANYVARLGVREVPGRTANRLRQPRPAENIRWRFYDTGAALCFLSDRLSPGWRERTEREPTLPLADLLASALRSRAAAPAVFSNTETARFRRAAEDSSVDLGDRQKLLRAELLARSGARMIVDVTEAMETLRVQRFDPINLMVLDAGEIAHANYVSLAAPYGTIELTNPRFVRGTFRGSVGLTAAAGRHPLRDGVRQLTIVGIEGTPRIGRVSDTITLDAPGVRLTLRGAEARVDSDAIRISVKRPATAALARR